MKQIKNLMGMLLISASAMSFAQVTLGVKAHMLFQTDKPTWSSISNGAVNAYNDRGSNNVGYNVGLSAKIGGPVGLFVQPEIYYTTFKNDFTIPGTNNSTATDVSVKSNRVDVPVLVGYNILGKTLGVFIGPVASFNLSSENQWQNFKENAAKNFTVGYQFGAQVTLSNFVLSGRYEGALSDAQRTFVNSVTSQTVRYDNRQSLLLFGLGYNF